MELLKKFLRWKRMQRFSSYLAGALPEVIDERITRYESRIAETDISRKRLREELEQTRNDLNISRNLSLEYEERNNALKGALKSQLIKDGELSVENEELKRRIENQTSFTLLFLLSNQERRRFYMNHICSALKSLREITDDAKKLRADFDGRLSEIEEKLSRKFDEESKKLATDYREGLVEYERTLGAIIDRHDTRADEAEKQQVFLQGALTRKDIEFKENIIGYASFVFTNLGANTALSKSVGIILNRQLEPLYATPRFLEVFGINSDRDLHKIQVPQLVCSTEDHKDRTKIRYRDNSGKEHLGTIYSTPIFYRGRDIGTYLQIDQTTGDWIKEKAHLSSGKMTLIDLISGGSIELRTNN